MKKSKGFLGPIGDDLPSLIPLLFALVMFFYVFTFTWNVFDERGREFNDSIDALSVGNTMKGNNYIRGFEGFEQNCNESKNIKRIKFLAGLVPLSTGPGQSFSGIDIENMESLFFYQNDQKFSCTNILEDSDERPRLESQNLVVRSFPVALEFKTSGGAFYVRPMLLVVVTWR